MNIAASILIGVGAFGLFQSTFGGVIFAWIYRQILIIFSRRAKRPRVYSHGVSSIDFLLVAHNEEDLIIHSLNSLSRAKEEFKRIQNIPVRIFLGVDHCKDRTESVARKWALEKNRDIEIIQNPGARGKWHALQHLIMSSEAEWVALVDVGAIWSEGLLGAAMPYLVDPEVMGIAPSYRATRSGLFESLSWFLERYLKKVESKVGGPVSVHGATVFYRRRYLVRILHELSLQTWLNDDVVIPLAMRSRWPNLKISYLSKPGRNAWIRDEGMKTSSGVEYGRRKRMMLGNLQWINSIYRNAFRSDLTVGLLASRRVFRTFWAYWILSISIGIFLFAVNLLPNGYFGFALLLMLAIAVIKFPLEGGAKRLRSAFWAGLEIPFYWAQSKNNTERQWS